MWDKAQNFGSRDVLSVYGSLRLPLLRFNISSVPAAAVVRSARLILTFQEINADYPVNPKRFFAADLARNFSESEANYTQYAAGRSWSAEGLRKYSDYAAIPWESAPLLAGDPGQYAIDVTDLVETQRAAGQSDVSVTLYSKELNAGGTIYSRECANASQRPRLEIEYSTTAPRVRVPAIVFSQFGAVRLDASQSSLPGGAKPKLDYAWSVARPAPGSSYSAEQNLGSTPELAFRPDQPGYYEIRVAVKNPATGEQSQAIAKVISGLNPHPRLHINQVLLGQLKYLRGSGDPVWTRFYNWVRNKPAYSDIEGGVLTSYLLAHLVTGERQYFDWAWEMFRGKIYKNATDRSQGLTRLIDLYGGDNHSAAYEGGPFIAQVAQLYDWGYEQLTAAQRQDLIDWLNDATAYNYLHNGAALDYFRNDGAAFTYGLAASAYATLGENPEAPKQFLWFRKNWDEILKALDIMGKGGASGEGNAYGSSPTASSFIRLANMIYYASGEDLFLSHPWFRKRLIYDAFATYPGTVGGPNSPAGPRAFVEQSSIAGDGRRGASWHSVSLRPNGLMLSRRFAGTEEASIWNWVFRQPAIDREGDDANSFCDLLYYSPPPQLNKPTRLSYFDPSMGFAYIRSDWDSPDATWISFWAGPHLDTHEHLDQGAFTIYKRRDVAPKTGHYDLNVNSPHDLAWYTRTVSSNGLLIGDPNETFRNFISGIGCDEKGRGASLPTSDKTATVCVPNDGGQRTMSPFGLGARDAAFFETYRDVFDVARVLEFQDTGRSVKVVADITNAYNNPRYSTPSNTAKAKKVYRRLIYLRDLDLVLLGDTVESRNPLFEKKWLLHGLQSIDVAGQEERIAPGESTFANASEAKIVVDDGEPSDKFQKSYDLRAGYASLLLKTVFPKDHRYRKIGGRDAADTPHEDVYAPDGYNLNKSHYHRHVRDFYVKDFSEGAVPNHKSANWPPESPLETANLSYAPTFAPGYGRWRLEVEPAAPNAMDFFLHVLKPSLEPAAKLPAVHRFETAEEFGVEIPQAGGKWRVRFSKTTPAASVLFLRESGSGIGGVIPPVRSR